jgi:hypothetical protein
MEEDLESRLLDEFADSVLSKSDSKMLAGEYGGSLYQIETYKKNLLSDNLYQNFIKQNYGSFDNYLQQNKVNEFSSVYDPTSDFRADVKIITKEASYTSDHISSQEVIMENLSGVCTIFFTKKTNGMTRRLTCTLNEQYMPTSEFSNRSNFFSPMGGDRIGVWDINEQAWKSFYMSSVFKFVRDDTVGNE